MPRHRRITAKVVAAALLSQLLAVGMLLTPALTPEVAAAGPEISLTKDAPATVLAGEEATYRLTVTNTGDQPEYNISLSDLLPYHASYVSGSTTPADADAAAVTSTDPVTGRQLIVWRNLTDLQPGGSYTLTFRADLHEAGQEVGRTVLNTANAASQTDPREVPQFDSSGVPVPGTYTESATGSATTLISAIDVEKANDNSPEGELLRGVHDQRSTYTLTVRNNEIAATDSIVLTDYLPAGLEFLGCGNVDNTQPASAVEYPGAPRLGVPPINPASCATPTSVDTVTDPPPANGVVYPEGVYTKVQWSVGSLAPGATATVRYAAGIPLRANTDTWPNGRPAAASGLQGSNLDNNTGASSRELADESSLTNYADVTGEYTGPTLSGDPTVFGDTDHAVTVEDVRMRKSVSPSGFSTGGIATFTIVVDTSEYVTGSGIVVTDVLPDGYCPLAPGENYAPGSPAECGSGGSAPSPAFDTVAYDAATGAYTITFEPLADMGVNDTATITFTARMQGTYTGDNQADRPTVAGDSFTDVADLDATTTPIAGTGESGTVEVHDHSTATQSTGAPTLDKQTKPRDTSNLFTGDPLVDCALATAPAYGKSSTFTPAQRTFRQGDQICFKLRIDFPDEVHTREPIVNDFFPTDTAYVVNSAAPTANNTVTIANLTTSSSLATWTLGDLDSGVRFANPGDVFEVVLAVTVLEPAAPPKPDLLGNLLKSRWSNTAGDIFAGRDQEDFDLAPGANVALRKGVYEVDEPPNGPNPPDQDGKVVQEDSVATFRVDVTNLGREGYPGAEFSARGLQTWDVLPAGIGCAAISNYRVSPHGTAPDVIPLVPAPTALDPSLVDCTDPGDPGHPSVDPAYGNSATQSVIAWTFPDPDLANAYSVSPGQTMTLLYDMELPSQISVSTRFDNIAAVRSFASFTNILNVTSEYYPADNIDTTVIPEQENVDAASDPSWVVTSDTSVLKAVTTSIGESNNNIPNQATIGETVTYTIGVSVPAHTTVYNGVLTDPMPTGLVFVSATANLDGGALPGGFTFNGAASGTLTFPTTYQNTTDDAQVFQVVITARMGTLASNTHGTVRTNTATFNSTTAASGGSALPARTAQAQVRVVEPNPSITKTASPTSVIGGQEVDYTLTAGNAAGRPPSHDTVVVDCIPAQIQNPQVTSVDQGTYVIDSSGTGLNGCAVGETKITWTVGTVLAGASNRKNLRYTATVDPLAAGGAQYTNHATLTGSTINGADPNERTYTRTAQATVTVVGQDITKGVSPANATIGESVDYLVATRIPASTTFYESTVLDTLPAGLAATGPKFSTVSVECFDEGTLAPCTGLDPTFGTPLTSSGQTVGWYVGDLASSLIDRFVVVRYRTVVLDDPANVAGATRVNSAVSRWGTDPGTPTPTSVTEALTLPQSVGPATATLTILEPNLSITKDVDNATPQLDDTLTYSVTITNASGATVSDAFEVDTSDVVPTGVVVSAASISDGGTISGANPTTGGGTITWSDLGPIAPGGSITLTYTATLAPSANLTDAALTNTASITDYWSLPTGNPDRRQYDGPSDPATVTPQFPQFTTAKSVTSGTLAYIGDAFGWTVTVTNSGGGNGFDVQLVDTLPPNWTYVDGSAQVTIPSPGGTATAIDPTVNTAGDVQTLTWNDLGDLPAGIAALVTFSAVPGPDVVVDPGVGLSVAHTNTAIAVGEDVNGATANADGSYSGGPDTAEAYIASADLALVKTAASPTVSAGGSATWTINVNNLGVDPSAAPFTVTDVLPEGAIFTSATGTGWTCVLEDDDITITCTTSTPASLPSGQSLSPITVVAGVPANTPDGTQFTNTATVTGPTHDPNPENNTDDETVTVLTEADLAITKTTVTSPVVAGAPVTYTLAVSNLGPSDSIAPITVTDTLPGTLTYTSASGTGWVCAAVGQAISCERNTALAAGANAPAITVVATLAASATGNLVNTAVVTGTTPDPEPDNNTDTVTDPITTSADLAIDKATVGVVVAGQPVTYTLAVSNLGPSVSAAPITVVDTLPAGLTYTSATGTDWSCGAALQVITCTRATALAVGPAPVITVVAQSSPGLTGSITNPADVTGTTPDPNPSNNHDEVVDPVDTQADLAIVKSHTGDTPLGSTVDFTLAVTNLGPSSAAGVTVTDTLPAGLTPTAATGTGWTCTITGQAVACDLDAPTLAPGAATPITVSATVGVEAVPTVTNTATVDSDTDDPNPDNNHDDDTILVPASVDLTITKSHTGNFVVGRQGTFTLVVGNLGPTRAPGPITVTDTLPTGLAYVSATGTGWTCSAAGQTVTCTSPDTIEVGATSTISLVVDVLPAARPQVVNPAEVSSGNAETNTDNNRDTNTVVVGAQVDLSLRKTGALSSDGGTATWTITVSNAGPSPTVAPVVVTDTLPSSLTYVSGTGTGWSCSASGQTVTCTYTGVIAAGGSAAALSIVTRVSPSAEGTISNVATASTEGEQAVQGAGAVSGIGDPNPSQGTPLAYTGGLAALLALLGLGLVAVGRTVARIGIPRSDRRPRRPRRHA